MSVLTVHFQLSEKQAECLHYLRDKSTREILFGGGAGGAKSFIGTYWLHTCCAKYPGTRWVMGRAELKTLKETTLNTFFEMARLVPITDWNFNQQQNTINYKNGSQIILKDLFLYPRDPNFDSLGSLEITGAFVDEANEITIKARNVLRSRIRYKLDQYGIVPKILFTCNPARNWVYSDFYRPSVEGTLRKDRAFIQSLVGDNPFMSKYYVENLQGLDKNTKERLLHGNWEYDDDPSTLMDWTSINDMFTNDFIDEGKMYISADIALHGSDRFVVLVWSGWRVVGFYAYTKLDPKEVERKLLEISRNWRVPQSQITYDADGLGSYLKGYLRNAVPFRNGSRPMGKKKVREEYANLKSQMYFRLADKINKKQIYFGCDIDVRYKEMLKEELAVMKNATHGTDRKLMVSKKEDVREDIQRSPDFADALMMRGIFDETKVRRSPRVAN